MKDRFRRTRELRDPHEADGLRTRPRIDAVAVDLWSHDDVSQHADAISSRGSAPAPCVATGHRPKHGSASFPIAFAPPQLPLNHMTAAVAVGEPGRVVSDAADD
jgi:hypothetical protein